jgi:ATP-dependent DNA ligase
LALFIDRELGVDAVLDGEGRQLRRGGQPRFYELMFGRGDPAFVAFDILLLEGRDLRGLALIERKKILRHLIPRCSSFVLFADYIGARGCDFYRLVCARDLEGIVAKWKAAPYRPDVAPVLAGSRSKIPSIARRGTGPSCSNGNPQSTGHLQSLARRK